MDGFRDTSYTLTILENNLKYYTTDGCRIRANIEIPYGKAMSAQIEIYNIDESARTRISIGQTLTLTLEDGVMINGYIFSFQNRKEGANMITTLFISSTFAPRGVKKLSLSVKKSSSLSVLIGSISGLGVFKMSNTAKVLINKTILNDAESYYNYPQAVLTEVCRKHGLEWTMVQVGEVFICTIEEQTTCLTNELVTVSYKDDTLVNTPTINNGWQDLYNSEDVFQTVTVKSTLNQSAVMFGGLRVDAMTFSLANSSSVGNLTSASGLYVINKITHSIDNYSMEWYTTLEGWTKND